jgi:hypothetical protein
MLSYDHDEQALPKWLAGGTVAIAASRQIKVPTALPQSIHQGISSQTKPNQSKSRINFFCAQNFAPGARLQGLWSFLAIGAPPSGRAA